ncbi:MAG TPA: hypothetical protein EYN66_19095, partial [Myxococcales bacterium]|nr:hypothetical protein [Myxococcales bacterium]
MRNGIHTLRGTIETPQGIARRAALFNGSWTKNFKVVSVNIFPSTIVNNDAILILHFDDVQKLEANAKDNAQFGWATTDGLAQDWSYVDPDHILVDDLFISANTAAPGEVNYIIKLEL